MPRIDVEVEATGGSTIGRADAVGHSVFARTHHADGWPVGWGQVARAVNEDGSPLEALVLMTEPAFPGRVHAWAIGVIDLGDRHAGQILVCVAEVPPFIDLIDLAHPNPWHADADAWLHALRRLHTGSNTPRHLQGLGDRRTAEAILAAARRRFAAGVGPAARLAHAR